MVKRKRVPLELNGTDEQYFRTRETAQPQAIVDTPKPIVSVKAKAPKTKKTSQKISKAKPAPTAPTAPVTTPVEIQDSKSEIISRIIHLGMPLSKRVQATAEKFGVPVDDLLYAARKKAVVGFRKTLAGSKKPNIAKFVKGGETLRIAVSLTEKELEQLNHWFDPLDLGLGTKMVSPLLTESLRRELEVICDAGA